MFNTEGTKYHPLFEHLLFSGQGQLTMTFAEIEAVLGAQLPPSASTRQEWWSNSPRGHSQAKAWMRASYETSQVDLEGGKVTFTLKGWPEGYRKADFFNRPASPAGAGFAEPTQPFVSKGEKEKDESEHPLFGIWKGKVKLVPGYDYTMPAFDADDELGE
jgi:hypothetical protein